MPGSSFVLGITVYDTDGTTVMSDVNVSIRNETTNETSSNNTDTNGQVVFNLADDFTSGWTAGDIVSYWTLYQGYEAEGSFTTTDTGGSTVSLTLVSKTVSPSLRYFTVQDFLDTYDLCTYDQDKESGVKPQVIVNLGQQMEKNIDNLTYRVWDNNSGSYYPSSDEYKTVKYYQNIFWLDNTPVNEITRIELNINLVSSEEDWKNIMYSLLDGCDATTDWVAGTDGAITLNTSNDEVKEGTGCLNITKTGATQTSVLYSKTLSSTHDFSGTRVKFDFYCEDITELTSSGTAVEIRIGTDASNYYAYVFQKNKVGQGSWNVFTLDHDSDDSNASTTGSPDATACDYVAINVTYAASSTTVTAGDMRLDYIRFNDKEDVNINYNNGRVEIISSQYSSEPGKDQIRFTYTYGPSSVPYDIKRLAILMTGKSFSKRTLQGLNIKTNEISGLSSAPQIANIDDDEINTIIERNKFPPIYNSWKENAQY